MKKNKIYKAHLEGKTGNNQTTCNVNEEIVTENEIDVEDKLNKLFNTNGYIFNIKVKIITDDKAYDTKIASRVGNSLITLDNDVININDVKDIIF